MSCSILICQNRACRKQGSAKVLAAFAAIALPPGLQVIASGCLGQCGNGPMVLILPEVVWYSHVRPQDAAIVVAKLSRDKNCLED